MLDELWSWFFKLFKLVNHCVELFICSAVIKDEADVLMLELQKFWLNYGIWVEESLKHNVLSVNGQETVCVDKAVGQLNGLIELL